MRLEDALSCFKVLLVYFFVSLEIGLKVSATQSNDNVAQTKFRPLSPYKPSKRAFSTLSRVSVRASRVASGLRDRNSGGISQAAIAGLKISLRTWESITHV